MHEHSEREGGRGEYGVGPQTSLLHRNPSPVLRVCSDGSVQFANQAAREILDIDDAGSRSDLPGPLQKGVTAALAETEMRTISIRCRERDYVFELVPVAQDACVNVYGRDVTGQKQAERILQESELRLRAATENLAVGIWELDLKTGEVQWDENTRSFYGMPQKSSISLGQLYDMIHPDDLSCVKQVVKKAREEGRGGTVQHRVLRPDGEVRWAATGGSVVTDEEGRPARMVGIGLDITDRKRAQQRIRRGKELSEALNRINEVLHSSLDFNEVADKVLEEGASVLNCDSAAMSLRRDDRWVVKAVYGMSSELVGEWIDDEQDPHAVLALESEEPVVVEDAFNDHRVNQQHMRRHGIRAALTVPLIRTDEPLGVVFFNYHSAPRTFAKEETHFAAQLAAAASTALANARLFEERRRTEQELKELNAELEQRVADRTAEAEQRAEQLQQFAMKLTHAEARERRRLAHVLHDDLQQILVSTKLRAEMAEANTRPDSELHEEVQSIITALAEAIDKSRTLSRDLHPPLLHSNGVVPALRRLADDMADKYEMDITCDIENDVPRLSEDIRIFLYHSVQELIFNAVKHAEAEHIQLNLSRNDGSLRITVADDGVGFDPEEMRRKPAEDRGFGLFGIEERAELLDGELGIESSPGQGSQFALTLPLKLEHNAPPGLDQRLPDTTAESPGESPTDCIQVLLADDHAVMRQGLVSLLERESGIEVVGEATDGQGAVEVAVRRSPDVVLMDVSMPEMNGIEATRRINEQAPGIGIIGLSLHKMDESKRKMLDAGADAYLTKDGPAEELLATIRELAAGDG